MEELLLLGLWAQEQIMLLCPHAANVVYVCGQDASRHQGDRRRKAEQLDG